LVLAIAAPGLAGLTIRDFASSSPLVLIGELRQIAAIVGWTLLPPIWFFLEYWLIDLDFIIPAGVKKETLETCKSYADYASKIWAAVLAAVLFLYARSHHMSP
jgi:Mn2+/Fe2+ NRAMP family transporter